MRLISFGTAVALTMGSICASAVACSDSESPRSSTGQAGGGATASAGTPAMEGGRTGGGSGGSAPVMLPPGTSEMPKTIQCGGECTSARVGLMYADPCCAGQADDVCGLDTTYLAMSGTPLAPGCEPKNQPGEVDAACPSPEPVTVGAMGAMATLDAFAGCCRPSGTCGVVLNTVTAGGGLIPIAELGLGCVDAAPFFPGASPVPCSGDGGGTAGAGGGQGDGGGAGGNASGAAGATGGGEGGSE